MVGAAFSSREFKVNPEKVKSARKKSFGRFSVKTDENGEAVMNNLPDTGFPLSLGAEHGEYELPNLFGQREVIARLNKTGYADLTMKMQKKGTDVMDGKQKEAANNTRTQVQKTINQIGKALEGLSK